MQLCIPVKATKAMSRFVSYAQKGSRRPRGTTAEDLLNSIKDGSWRIRPSEPQYVTAPVPSRGRASYADIIDNEWELWRGGVRLVSTKQEAVQHDCLDDDSPYATWPPPSSLIQDANAFNNHNPTPVSGLGLELYPNGVRNEWSPDVEECGAEWGVESMQCDCYNCATVKWLQDEAEKAEVARLLDELLHLQRQRRAQEKMEKILLLIQSLPFPEPRTFDGVEPRLFDGIAGTKENLWGRADAVQYDATDSPTTSSSRPLSLSTSHTTAAGATPPSVEYFSAARVPLDNETQGRTNLGTYDASPQLPYIPLPASYSMASPPSILSRGLSILEATPKTSTRKASWGNRVGRRIKVYGRQIMGQA